VRDVGCVGPRDEVGGGVYGDDKVRSKGDDHHPAGGGGMPEDFRVTKLSAVGGKNGVTGEFGEGVAVVVGEGDVLGLCGGGVEGVDCYDAIGGVGEEAGGVVCIDDGGAAKDAFGWRRSEDGDGLVGPVKQVSRGCVAPMLVSSNVCGGIIWMGEFNGCILTGIDLSVTHTDSRGDRYPRHRGTCHLGLIRLVTQLINIVKALSCHS